MAQLSRGVKRVARPARGAEPRDDGGDGGSEEDSQRRNEDNGDERRRSFRFLKIDLDPFRWTGDVNHAAVRVVVAIAAATHTAPHALSLESCVYAALGYWVPRSEWGSRGGRPAARHGPGPGSEDEAGLERGVGGPAHDAPRIEVQE